MKIRSGDRAAEKVPWCALNLPRLARLDSQDDITTIERIPGRLAEEPDQWQTVA